MDETLKFQLIMDKQEKLIKLIEDCEAGKMNKVLIDKNVGFSDNKEIHDKIIKYLETLGISINFVDDKID